MDYKVSDPIYSQDNGFYRYNYEKERLEFIDYGTKTVTDTWEIPADQWLRVPSREQYCRNLTASEKAKSVALTWSSIVGLVVAVIMLIFLIITEAWILSFPLLFMVPCLVIAIIYKLIYNSLIQR